MTTLLAGHWRLRREQLHLTPTPAFQERLGVEVIIFDRLEEYSALDPEDWITEHIEHLMQVRSSQE